MAELKTRPTAENPQAFLNRIANDKTRADCLALATLMQEVTGAEPTMWGDSIIGFGSYHYRYPTGREGDWFLTGFSPRKQNITLYIMAGFDDADSLMARLGKYTTGKSCLYVKRLGDVDMAVLRELVTRSVEVMRATNAPGPV